MSNKRRSPAHLNEIGLRTLIGESEAVYPRRLPFIGMIEQEP